MPYRLALARVVALMLGASSASSSPTRSEPRDSGRVLSADHVLKYMVGRGRKVAAFPLQAHLHLGSPAELREFEFWTKHYGLFQESR